MSQAADQAQDPSPLRPRRPRFRERLDPILELSRWVREKQVYWAVPILVFLFLLSFLIYLTSGSAIAPFFYAIF